MMLCVVRELCWCPCRWPPGSRWCSSSGVHAGRRWTRLTAGTPGPPSGHPAEGCRSHRDTWGPGGPGGGRPAGRLERDRGQQHKPSHNCRRASGCVGLCIIPNVLVQCQFGYLGFSTGSRTIVFFCTLLSSCPNTNVAFCFFHIHLNEVEPLQNLWNDTNFHFNITQSLPVFLVPASVVWKPISSRLRLIDRKIGNFSISNRIWAFQLVLQIHRTSAFSRVKLKASVFDFCLSVDADFLLAVDSSWLMDIP